MFTACKASSPNRFWFCCSTWQPHVLVPALETEIVLFQAAVSASKKNWRFFSPLEGKMQSKPWGCCIKGTVISKQYMWTAAVILPESSVTTICSFIAQVHVLQARHRNPGAQESYPWGQHMCKHACGCVWCLEGNTLKVKVTLCLINMKKKWRKKKET